VVGFAGYKWNLEKVSLVDVCLLDAPHFMETISPLEFYAENSCFLTKPGMKFYLQKGHEEITSIRLISCLLNGEDLNVEDVVHFL
jgi:hypothetical protein